MGSGRCGHTLDDDARRVDLGEICCWRPVWDDRDRCVWHADVDGKPLEALEEHEPSPGEFIDGAVLRGTTLTDVDWLADCVLVGADFSDADLREADLSGANLVLATFRDTVARNANFRRANLEGAVFRDVDLRGADLLHTRLDEAVFADIYIDWKTRFGRRSVYERDDVEPSLSDRHPLEAAAWGYRVLQGVFQSNSLPQRSREYFVREKDARRSLAWAVGEYPRAVAYSADRWVMLYGSSPWRILVVSSIVVALFAALYPVTGGIQEVDADRVVTYAIEDPESAPPWWLGEVYLKSLYFSVVTFATLGYGDIQPIGGVARALAGIEALLGALLAALLVFVLARRVTW